MTIAADQTFTRAEGVEFRETGGEVFIVDGDGQTILHLNPTGSAIWRLLEEPTCPADAAALLAEAFPMVDKTRIEADVTGIFATLDERGFIASAG